MNKTLIFRKIGGIISELHEQYQYLAENPENINPLELELFIANSHFLAEHLAILKKLEGSPGLLNQNNPPAQPVRIEEAATSPAVELPVKEEPRHAADTAPLPVMANQGEWFRPETTHAFNKTENIEILPADTVDEEMTVADIPDVPRPAEESPKSFEAPAPFISANLHSEPEKELLPHLMEIKEEQAGGDETDAKVPTLNEILSASLNKENIAAKISSQEDKDLKSMIKLNDKLMFVRDLFGGYNLAYSEAIELINRFDSFIAADNFLKQNYAVKNKWSEKQGTVDQFYEILNRRFS